MPENNYCGYTEVYNLRTPGGKDDLGRFLRYSLLTEMNGLNCLTCRLD